MPTIGGHAGYVALPENPLAKSPPAWDRPAAKAPPPKPAMVTLMRAPDIAKSLNQQIDESGAEVPDETTKGITKAAEKIESNLKLAKSVGVDATKHAFYTKVLGAGVAALALAVVVSLSVATGGAPLVAAAAIAGVVLAISVADVYCSHLNRQNAKALESDPDGVPPHKLPMGDSSVANLLYKGLRGLHMGHGAAKVASYCVDLGLRYGMMILGGLFTGGASIAANSFEHIAPMVAGALNLTNLMINIKATWGSNATYERHKSEIKAGFHQLSVDVNRLPERDRPAMLQKVKDSERAALQEIEAMRGAVPRRAQVLPRSIFQLGYIVTGILATLMPGSGLAAARFPFGEQNFATPVVGGVGGLATGHLTMRAARARVEQDDVELLKPYIRTALALTGQMRQVDVEALKATVHETVTEAYDGNSPSPEYGHWALQEAVLQMLDQENPSHPERLAQLCAQLMAQDPAGDPARRATDVQEPPQPPQPLVAPSSLAEPSSAERSVLEPAVTAAVVGQPAEHDLQVTSMVSRLQSGAVNEQGLRLEIEQLPRDMQQALSARRFGESAEHLRIANVALLCLMVKNPVSLAMIGSRHDAGSWSEVGGMRPEGA